MGIRSPAFCLNYILSSSVILILFLDQIISTIFSKVTWISHPRCVQQFVFAMAPLLLWTLWRGSSPKLRQENNMLVGLSLDIACQPFPFQNRVTVFKIQVSREKDTGTVSFHELFQRWGSAVAVQNMPLIETCVKIPDPFRFVGYKSVSTV